MLNVVFFSKYFYLYLEQCLQVSLIQHMATHKTKHVVQMISSMYDLIATYNTSFCHYLTLLENVYICGPIYGGGNGN